MYDHHYLWAACSPTFVDVYCISCRRTTAIKRWEDLYHQKWNTRSRKADGWTIRKIIIQMADSDL
jgi:hypothetical protein